MWLSLVVHTYFNILGLSTIFPTLILHSPPSHLSLNTHASLKLVTPKKYHLKIQPSAICKIGIYGMASQLQAMVGSNNYLG